MANDAIITCRPARFSEAYGQGTSGGWGSPFRLPLSGIVGMDETRFSTLARLGAAESGQTTLDGSKYGVPLASPLHMAPLAVDLRLGLPAGERLAGRDWLGDRAG